LPKYRTGSYSLTTFDQYGTKLALASCPSLTDASVMGEDAVARGDAFSYVIQRVIVNSLDNAWESKRTPNELDDLARKAGL